MLVLNFLRNVISFWSCQENQPVKTSSNCCRNFALKLGHFTNWMHNLILGPLLFTVRLLGALSANGWVWTSTQLKCDSHLGQLWSSSTSYSKLYSTQIVPRDFSKSGLGKEKLVQVPNQNMFIIFIIFPFVSFIAPIEFGNFPKKATIIF